jgi:hypothetical protein
MRRRGREGECGPQSEAVLDGRGVEATAQRGPWGAEGENTEPGPEGMDVSGWEVEMAKGRMKWTAESAGANLSFSNEP